MCYFCETLFKKQLFSELVNDESGIELKNDVDESKMGDELAYFFLRYPAFVANERRNQIFIIFSIFPKTLL